MLIAKVFKKKRLTSMSPSRKPKRIPPFLEASIPAKIPPATKHSAIVESPPFTTHMIPQMEAHMLPAPSKAHTARDEENSNAKIHKLNPQKSVRGRQDSTRPPTQPRARISARSKLSRLSICETESTMRLSSGIRHTASRPEKIWNTRS